MAKTAPKTFFILHGDDDFGLEQELRIALGTKVEIKQSAKGRGTIVIHFTDSDDFDRKVAGAVARFRVRHGLPGDSVADRATIGAMNVPVERRIRQIEINLDRYRWLPAELTDRYVLVNIPDYHLYAYDDGKLSFEQRVIVGDQYQNATPVFADSMTYLVFRPEWNVPPGISN